MSQLYECTSCRTVKTSPDGLCRPTEALHICINRTLLNDNLERLCNYAAETVDYCCTGCGRLSEDPELFCFPVSLRR